jgi:hypothetical protein
MTRPSFTAEASLYATSLHYGNVVFSTVGIFDSVLAQQLCRQLGQTCGGIDLFCCPGLTCTAGLGGDGVCVPDDRLADGHLGANSPPGQF